MSNYVVRFNLKTRCKDVNGGRKALLDFCLRKNTDNNSFGQCLAIGWSNLTSQNGNFETFDDFYKAVDSCKNKRIDPALNIFKFAKANDLFWTRDESGIYWICRITGKAVAYKDVKLDIGAILPVEAYRYTTEVPGQIKAAFNRARGGIVQKIYGNNIFEYSKLVFNKLSKREHYCIESVSCDNLISNLPDFELEELVISYIQIKYNYYLLSNSIAKNSTTPLIECEFKSREKGNSGKAVVQVKGGNKEIDVSKYQEYLNEGSKVFLYSSRFINEIDDNNIIYISKEELLEFYNNYKSNLPNSITKWENIFEN